MSTPAPSQTARLRAALKETRLSHRRLAILLQKQQPTRTLDNVRSQLGKWIRDDRKGWSDESAERLAAAFRAEGHIYPAEYFAKNPDEPQTWAEQMTTLVSRVEELEAEMHKRRETS